MTRDDLMPGAGLLVHMASHTYFRVGRYADSTLVNIMAIEADETYFGSAASEPVYAAGYYPHNIHSALASAQMSGNATTTFEYVERLAGKIPDDIAGKIGWIQAIKIAPYIAHA